MYIKLISGCQQEFKTILCNAYQYKLIKIPNYQSFLVLIKPSVKNQIVIFVTDGLLYDDTFFLLHNSG